MKITLFNAKYSEAGVSLAQGRLAKLFVKKGYKVDFIIGSIVEGVELPKISGVNIIHLDVPRALNMFIPIIKYLKSSKPDIIISAEDHMNIVASLSAILANSKAKIVVTSRISATRVYTGKFLSKNWFFQKIYGLVVVKYADVLGCVSKDMAKEYNDIFKTNKFIALYNLVFDNHSKEQMKESIDEPWLINKTTPMIVAAGTLTKRKGFNDLIMAMKEVVKTVDVKLIILGEGYQRNVLEDMIKKENLSSNIKLIGHKQNPLAYFYHSDIFVLASYAEGMPNVLIQGIMCGCTPVAADCPTGPAEIIQDDKYGYLVPMKDPMAMAEGIKKALEKPISKEDLEKISIQFTEDEVFNRYKTLLNL